MMDNTTTKTPEEESAVDCSALLDALREIKLTALTTTDGPRGLAHIVRICIDAGVTEKLDVLMASNNNGS